MYLVFIQELKFKESKKFNAYVDEQTDRSESITPVFTDISYFMYINNALPHFNSIRR